MFGICTVTMHAPHSFEACHKLYGEIKPWRDSCYPLAKPLDENRRKKHLSIRPRGKSSVEPDSYACRLYNTDVVVYHRDGKITINRYDTRSTKAFANRLLPAELRYEDDVLWISRYDGGYAWDGKGWQISKGGITVEPYGEREGIEEDQRWHVIDSKPFEWRTVNRKRANAAYKKRGLNDFVSWVRGIIAMNVVIPPSGVYHYGGWGEEPVTSLLDRSKWSRLLADRVPGVPLAAHAESMISRMRYVIVRDDGCLDEKSCEYVTSMRRVKNIKNNQWRY